MNQYCLEEEDGVRAVQIPSPIRSIDQLATLYWDCMCDEERDWPIIANRLEALGFSSDVAWGATFAGVDKAGEHSTRYDVAMAIVSELEPHRVDQSYVTILGELCAVFSEIMPVIKGWDEPLSVAERKILDETDRDFAVRYGGFLDEGGNVYQLLAAGDLFDLNLVGPFVIPIAFMTTCFPFNKQWSIYKTQGPNEGWENAVSRYFREGQVEFCEFTNALRPDFTAIETGNSSFNLGPKHDWSLFYLDHDEPWSPEMKAELQAILELWKPLDNRGMLIVEFPLGNQAAGRYSAFVGESITRFRDITGGDPRPFLGVVGEIELLSSEDRGMMVRALSFELLPFYKDGVHEGLAVRLIFEVSVMTPLEYRQIQGGFDIS